MLIQQQQQDFLLDMARVGRETARAALERLGALESAE